MVPGVSLDLANYGTDFYSVFVVVLLFIFVGCVYLLQSPSANSGTITLGVEIVQINNQNVVSRSSSKWTALMAFCCLENFPS